MSLIVASLSVLILTVAVKMQEEEVPFPAPDFFEAIKPVVEKCELEIGVDKEIVRLFSEGTLSDDEKLKCYMKCMFLQFEVLEPETGAFHYEKMFRSLPESMKKIAFRMGKNCLHFKGEGGSDLCQVSYDLHKCWQQADPEPCVAYGKGGVPPIDSYPS